MIRQPIVSVLGHVDHGKTSILDRIRGTAVTSGEAGKITQHIGASEIPTDVVEKICKDQLDQMGIELQIPGLLFIDTPGHEAFTNLRKRGGSIADLGVLVIDVTQGVKPQTEEALKILKQSEVPFVIAANKVDRIKGWDTHENTCIAKSMPDQSEEVKKRLDEKIYEIVGKVHDHGFTSERYDRVNDFTKQIVIVPTSAETGEGIPELLMYIAGLNQKYLSDELEIDPEEEGKGTVLEVKKLKGHGTTLDTIIYEGVIKKGDEILIEATKPIETYVKALLRPRPLEEIRDKKSKFKQVDSVTAAAGVKISAPDLDDVLSGARILVANTDKERKRKELEAEETELTTGKTGVILKTDTLGSLEAIKEYLENEEIPVRRAGVGNITKKDIIEAHTVKQKEKYLGVVFGFNTDLLDEEIAKEKGIKVIQSNVIYRLPEKYEEWKKQEKQKRKEELLEKTHYPAKIKVLPGYVFRQSNPAIVGIEVLGGIMKTDTPLINKNGKQVGRVKGLQEQKENIQKAEKGKEVAASIKGPTVGRQIKEGDVLYTNIPLSKIDELKEKIDEEKHLEILNTIHKIKKKRKRQTR